MVRVPNIAEIAASVRYIEAEYDTAGGVAGEQIAEGLAFGESIEGFKTCDPGWYAEIMFVAHAWRSELSDDVWQTLAARADYLRREQCEQPRYRV